MLYLKENTVGIDIPLQKIQTKLHAALLSRWGIDTAMYNCFGRVYRNQDKQGGYIPEAYKGLREYTDVLYNDRIIATSFFGVGNQTDYIGNNTFKATVHLIFCLNIDKIKTAIEHRADEEIHQDVINALRSGLRPDTIQSIVTGMDAIFREYGGYKSQNGIIFTDMHPKHCFRINFELTFINNNC